MTALDGVRVLDLTRLLPGAVATQMLCDHGAEVIKVEPPEGDYGRTILSSGGNSPVFEATNRGKKSIVLNLKQPADREALLRLAGNSDVLVESYRPGVMTRLGLGLEVLEQRNPRLVVASLSGYGQDGPYRDLAGHDINYLAMSGVLDLIGTRDGAPAIPGIQIADIAGGAMQTVIGILMALLARTQTGRGQHVDVSMTDGVAPLLTLPLALGTRGRGADVLSGALACYNVYRCADSRWIAVGALEQKFWANLCRELGHPEWLSDQYGPEARQFELKRDLAAVFAARPAGEWFSMLGTKDCCVTPVMSLAEAAGQFRPSPRFSHTKGARSGRAPELGEHTGEVLG